MYWKVIKKGNKYRKKLVLEDSEKIVLLLLGGLIICMLLGLEI